MNRYIIYYNISHLMHRVKTKNKKYLSNSLIEYILGDNYNINSAIDIYSLAKLSNLLNKDLFNFLMEELKDELENLNISLKENEIIEFFKKKIKRNEYTITDITNGLGFNPLIVLKNENKILINNYNEIKIGSIIQFLLYLQNISLHEFSEKNNLKIYETLDTFKRTNLTLCEIIIWSIRTNFNLFTILSLNIRSSKNYNKS